MVGGKWLKEVGDGTLASFATITDANTLLSWQSLDKNRTNIPIYSEVFSKLVLNTGKLNLIKA